MSNKIPALNTLADTDWTDSSLDDVIEKESGFRSLSPTSNVYQSTQQPSSQSNQQQPAVTNTQQSVQQAPQFKNPELEVLESELAGSEDNAAPIVTKTSEYQTNGGFVNTDDVSTVSNVEQTSNDVYVRAFELMADLDMIRIPEDVDIAQLDAETLIDLKEQTLEQQRQEAYDYMRDQVGHDQYMLELLDYAVQGGKFVNVPRMVDILQKDVDYRVLDLNNENIQKELVKRYLSLGLNPNSERDQKLLSFIPDKINTMLKDKVLRQEAEAARKHFLTLQEEAKRAEYQRVIQAQENEQRMLQQQQEQAEQWEKDFRNALAAKNWSEERKERVKREFQNVRLQDGTQIPAWEYKRQLIFNNPALFQQFLDFTANLDIKTGTFTGENNQDENLSQSAVNKLVERLKNKGQNTQTANTNPRNPSGEGKPKVVNPTNWF